MDKKDILEEFESNVWHAFHAGEFDDQDGYYTWYKEYIDRENIYTKDSKNFVDVLDYDVFAIHAVWGRPNSWKEAGMNALDDYLTENSNVWGEITQDIEAENQCQYICGVDPECECEETSSGNDL